MIPDLIEYSHSIEWDSTSDINVLCITWRLMVSLWWSAMACFKRETQFALVMLSMTCGKRLCMGWCVIKIQYSWFGLHGYIWHELVFDARSAVSYVYSGLHGIRIISSLLMVRWRLYYARMTTVYAYDSMMQSVWYTSYNHVDGMSVCFRSIRE